MPERLSSNISLSSEPNEFDELALDENGNFGIAKRLLFKADAIMEGRVEKSLANIEIAKKNYLEALNEWLQKNDLSKIDEKGDIRITKLRQEKEDLKKQLQERMDRYFGS